MSRYLGFINDDFNVEPAASVRLAAANRANFMPDDPMAPQYVLVPNMFVAGEGFYDVEYQVDPPEMCYDRIIQQFVRLHIGRDADIVSMEVSECTCDNADLRYFCATLTLDTGKMDDCCLYIGTSPQL